MQCPYKNNSLTLAIYFQSLKIDPHTIASTSSHLWANDGTVISWIVNSDESCSHGIAHLNILLFRYVVWFRHVAIGAVMYPIFKSVRGKGYLSKTLRYYYRNSGILIFSNTYPKRKDKKEHSKILIIEKKLLCTWICHHCQIFINKRKCWFAVPPVGHLPVTTFYRSAFSVSSIL